MADIEMLPLPKKAQLANPYAGRGIPTYGHSDETLTDYARAVAEHNVKKRDAEIEALRAECLKALGLSMQAQAEAKELRGACDVYQARAERLAEALREARAMVEDWAGYASEYFQDKHDLQGDLAKLDAALRDHDQEGKDG